MKTIKGPGIFLAQFVREEEVEAIRKHMDGEPMKTENYDFPTVYDGLRGMEFIYKAIELDWYVNPLQ